MTRGYLLDTHVLLWAWHDHPRQKAGHVAILESPADIFVSHATIWEIAIKVGLGKLTTIADVPAGIDVAGMKLLPIDLSHIKLLETLPHHHRDPFDRMIIAQAMIENLAILTVDPAFRAYDVAFA